MEREMTGRILIESFAGGMVCIVLGASLIFFIVFIMQMLIALCMNITCRISSANYRRRTKKE